LNSSVRNRFRGLLVFVGASSFLLGWACIAHAEPTTKVFKDGDGYVLQITNRDSVCYSFEYTEYRGGKPYTTGTSMIHKCDGVMTCLLESAKSMANIKISYTQVSNCHWACNCVDGCP
jgi:hypothetical protein